MKAYPEEVKERVRARYVPGVYGYQALSNEFGIPVSTIGRWVNPERDQRSREYSRALKERYRGTCVVCGKRTTGCHGPGKAPLFCTHHEPREAAKARRGTGPLGSKILEFMGEGPVRTSTIVEQGFSTPEAVYISLIRLRKYGLVKHLSYGVYQRT